LQQKSKTKDKRRLLPFFGEVIFFSESSLLLSSLFRVFEWIDVVGKSRAKQ